MNPTTALPIRAVGAIRVSSFKQGINGDSPEDQQRQIEQYAKSQGITVSKFFVFLESASKDQQPCLLPHKKPPDFLA
jgi:DNA invertase Pin-like site-specific DNA recombinase